MCIELQCSQVTVGPFDALGEISVLDSEIGLSQVGLDVAEVKPDEIGALYIDADASMVTIARMRRWRRGLTDHDLAASITHRPLPHPRSSTVCGGSLNSCMETPREIFLINWQFQSSLGGRGELNRRAEGRIGQVEGGRGGGLGRGTGLN